MFDNDNFTFTFGLRGRIKQLITKCQVDNNSITLLQQYYNVPIP